MAKKVATGTKNVKPQPGSAYFMADSDQSIEQHTMAVMVINEPGVLARVIGLFSGRGYNIESLTVASVTHDNSMSLITIVTSGTPSVVEQIKLQLKKLIPVHKVADFKRNDPNILFKELALFKVVSSKKNREKAQKLCKKYNSFILDKSKNSFVIQVTALRREIDKLIETLSPLGLVSTSRTGAVAMTRGSEIFK